MNKSEFINEIVGTQWVNRAYGFDGCDCFGLVYLYYSQVLQVLPTLSAEYLENNDFSVAFQAQLDTGEWRSVDRPDGNELVFMCFNGDIPMHCGVMIDRNQILHAFGDPTTGKGQVTIWNLSTMVRYLARYYKMDEMPRIEFYKWVGDAKSDV